MKTFEVTSGRIFVSDPCYKHVPDGQFMTLAKNGTWVGQVEVSDEGAWGQRIATLKAVHSDHQMLVKENDLKPVKDVWVDSGQMSIFDDEYYQAYITEDRVWKEDDPSETFYAKCCNLTISETKWGIVENRGVVSSSGFGDGSYPVSIAMDSDEKTVAVIVRFILDEDEEEDEYDE